MKNRKRLVSILALIMAAVMLLTLIAGLIPTPASAYSSSEIRKQINELKKQKAEVEQQIKDVQAQYKKNEDEIADIVARKNVIDQEIALLHAEVRLTNEEIAAFNVLIADKQEELDTATQRYEELNEQNKERIRAMEEDGSITYWEVLFKANNFSDLLDRLNMVEEIATSDQRRLKELAEAADAVELSRKELEAEKAELELVKAELDVAQKELDAKREEADALIVELLAKGAELEKLEEDFQVQKTEFLDAIAAKEQEYNQAKLEEWLAYMATYTTVPPATQAPVSGGTTSSNGNGNGNGQTTTGNAGVSNSTWLRPCSYVKMTSPFGMRESPTAGASTYHQGVDLAGPEGTPIYATRTGRVTVASYSGSAGYYVSINHLDGYSSIYMHMRNYVVSAGQTVSAGQLIGYMGNTGISTGSHLHFGVSLNGRYINPCGLVPI